MEKIKILLADDHQIILDGLVSMLDTEQSIEMLGCARHGEEVLDKIRSYPEIDVVVLDINMPGMDGLETTTKIKEVYPEIKVLILSMYNRVEFVKNLLESGADGYILKNAGKSTLVAAIHALSRDEPYYSAEITKTIMKGYQKARSFNPDLYSELSSREKEVIKLIALEMTTAQIADELYLSTHTIDTHRKNVLSKLDVKNAAGIVKFAIQTGIIKDFDLQ